MKNTRCKGEQVAFALAAGQTFRADCSVLTARDRAPRFHWVGPDFAGGASLADSGRVRILAFAMNPLHRREQTSDFVLVEGHLVVVAL